LLVRVPFIRLSLLLVLLVGTGESAADDRVPAASAARSVRARAVLQEILSTPEFAPPKGPTLRDRLSKRVRAWLLEFLRRTGIGGGSGRWLANTLAWGVAVLALIGLLVLIIRRRWRRDGSMPQPFAVAEARQSSREWVSRAHQAMAAGDAREAVRCAHMAAVLRFEEQGLWRTDQARTPREYVRLLPTSDRRRVPFHELTGEFERSWYGARAVDSSRIWQWLEACGCPVAHHPAT